MHVKSGEKLQLAVIFADFDGNAHEPSSYDVELWQTNNDNGETEQVTPTLVAGAEGKVDGYHLYEYETPSGDYTYLWRYYTTDTDVLAQEFPEMHYSGGWVDDLVTITNNINSATVQHALAAAATVKELYKYADFSESFTCSENLDSATEIWASIKSGNKYSDDDALVRLSLTGGLERVNGAAPVDAGNGTLAVNGVSVSVLVAAAELSNLTIEENCDADVKALIGGRIKVVWSGTFDIKATTTRKLS